MSSKHLTLCKREMLARLLSDGYSQRAIAKILDCSPSTISQELKRNRKYTGEYEPQHAHARARVRRRRANRAARTIKAAILQYVEEKLSVYWSPEQISERIRLDFPEDESMRISFKSIYNKVCPRKHEPRTRLANCRRFLRYKHILRKSFRHGQPKARQDRGTKIRSIEERPEVVLQKKRFGDWEADLICGTNHSGYLATFVERTTGLTFAWFCPDRKSQTVNMALTSFMKSIPRRYRLTITVDRGAEFYRYQEVEKRYSTPFYFCHPRSPQERGLNEYMNGLLRQFFPKKYDFKKITPAMLTRVLTLLANRPKKKFQYKTIMEVLQLQGLEHIVQF